jgi:hypothetical protein
MFKENIQNDHLEFSCRHCRRQTLGTLPPSTTSDWGCLPRYPTKRPSRAIARCGSADWDSVNGTWWRCTNFFLAFRGVLHNVFPEHWVGRSGPTAWPARSPDLNPLDFHLRRHPKSTVYATEVSDVQGLQQRTQNGLKMIRTIPGIFRRVTQSLFRRATLKLKLDTLNIVFNFQEAGTRKPCCRRPFFICILCVN